MASDDNKESGGDQLVEFLKEYTSLVNLHLNATRSVISTTVDELMDGVQKLNTVAEKSKSDAEQIINETYLNPDDATKNVVDDLQKNVSDLFEKVTRMVENSEDIENLESLEPTSVVESRLKKLTSHFSKSNLDSVDDEIKMFLFGLIGSLSSEDIIAQRITHIINCLHALQSSLSYILLDYENRSNSQFIEQTIKDLKVYTFNQYSSEAEKNEFRGVFEGKSNKKAS